MSFLRLDQTQTHYPTAIDTALLYHLLLSFSKIVLDKKETEILFATSVCSDDLNNVELPRTKMIGPFFLGGLDGFPFVGHSGMGAFAHHIPDDGMAIILFGPHVGIGKMGVGKVQRPGQSEPDSACCGAMAGLLSKLCVEGVPPESPMGNPFDRDLDSQQHYLFEILYERRVELRQESDPSLRFVKATGLVYDACQARLSMLLKGESFGNRPAIIVGGVLINEDNASGSLFAINQVTLINGKRLKSVKKLNLAADLDFPSDLSAEFGTFAARWFEVQSSAIGMLREMKGR